MDIHTGQYKSLEVTVAIIYMYLQNFSGMQGEVLNIFHRKAHISRDYITYPPS